MIIYENNKIGIIGSIYNLVDLKLSKNANVKYKKNYCYYHSLYWYDFYKLICPKGNYKINIVVSKNINWGHAWLTKDGKTILKSKQKISLKLEKIGENGKFIYWIAL